MQQREHKIKFLTTFWPKHILCKCWFCCGAIQKSINGKVSREKVLSCFSWHHYMGFAVIISQSKRGVYNVLPHWVLGEVDSKVGTPRFVVVWLLNKLQKLRRLSLIIMFNDQLSWQMVLGKIIKKNYNFEFLMLLSKVENNLDIHTILTAIVIHSIEVELLRPICNLNRKTTAQA